MGNRLGFGCENTYPENSLEIRTEQGVYRINVSRPRGHGNIYVRGRGSIYMRGRGRTYGIWSTHVRSGYVTFERTNGHGFRSYNAIHQNVAAIEGQDHDEEDAPDQAGNSGVEVLENSSTDGDFEDAEQNN
ncbi:uncharacterized protein LOC108031314 isoform X2 [Drosophila biarmipes]|uniref:uncharacterized protein LOC108031314 isoform X2 n=1 Tax=Drosophila biarmipes TaxID=125945 RepID=UPI0007E67DC2|nr:uncharacterized protein LOC108031314 isoform X2 [Drosophila biarmipes]